MNIQGGGGDRAHEATTVLTREAFRAAADPARYPEQIREGLRPWPAATAYYAGRKPLEGEGQRQPPAPPAGVELAEEAPGQPARRRRRPTPPHVTRVDTGVYDPLLGRTYAEIGNDARSNHKCQGVGGGRRCQVGPDRGGGRRRRQRTYTLVDTTNAGPEGQRRDVVLRRGGGHEPRRPVEIRRRGAAAEKR